MALKFDMSSPQWAQAANAQMAQQHASTAGTDIGYGVGSLIGGAMSKKREAWGKKYAKAQEKHDATQATLPEDKQTEFPEPKEWKKEAKRLIKEKKFLNKQKNKDEDFSNKLDERYKVYKQNWPSVSSLSQADWEAKHGMNLYDSHQSALREKADFDKRVQKDYRAEVKDWRKEDRRDKRKVRRAKRKAFFDKLLNPSRFKKEVAKPFTQTDVTDVTEQEQRDVDIARDYEGSSTEQPSPLINPNLKYQIAPFGDPVSEEPSGGLMERITLPGGQTAGDPSQEQIDEAQRQEDEQEDEVKFKEYEDYLNMTDEEKYNYHAMKKYKETGHINMPYGLHQAGQKINKAAVVGKNIVTAPARLGQKVGGYIHDYSPLGQAIQIGTDSEKRGRLGEALYETGEDYLNQAKGIFNYWTGD